MAVIGSDNTGQDRTGVCVCVCVNMCIVQGVNVLCSFLLKLNTVVAGMHTHLCSCVITPRLHRGRVIGPMCV